VLGSITSGTGPTTIGLTPQTTVSCPVPTGSTAAICLGSDMKLHCTLASGGSC
jgi:hypothetical protein